MIIIRNVKVSLDAEFLDYKTLLSKTINYRFSDDVTVYLYKKSIDARRKDNIYFNCAFTLKSNDEKALLKALKNKGAEPFFEEKYIFPKMRVSKKCVIVGFGPAGMFAALSLARAGVCPIVLERGFDVDTRTADVNSFFQGGVLKEDSNIQFGEGGAGTFSDGKLNTGIKDPRIRTVLKTFAEHGAGKNILYDAKPHIGTDVLVKVVKSIRKEIISLGGQVHFGTLVTAINVINNRVFSVSGKTKDGSFEIACDHLILAPGHSARDTFLMLKNLGVNMEPKPFAIGTRIEHLQKDINKSQYGDFAEYKSLGAADYRLATHLENGRGVFTFCMCPGGEVVNASSEKYGVVVNGMSNSMRDDINANSAVLVSVGIEDYYKNDVLDGMYFQQQVEQKAYSVGKGKPVCQTLGSFLDNSDNVPNRVIPSARTGVTFGDIHKVLPVFVTDSLKLGILEFDKKLEGFANKDALLTAPETRSSSPIRIVRDNRGQSSIKGLFPCGEGAGYAGGITSAATDGLKIAEMVLEQ